MVVFVTNINWPIAILVTRNNAITAICNSSYTIKGDRNIFLVSRTNGRIVTRPRVHLAQVQWRILSLAGQLIGPRIYITKSYILVRMVTSLGVVT
jgi:hypothetical protein